MIFFQESCTCAFQCHEVYYISQWIFQSKTASNVNRRLAFIWLVLEKNDEYEETMSTIFIIILIVSLYSVAKMNK